MPKSTQSEFKRKLQRVSIIRFIYLYLITAITFVVFIIGAVNIVDTVLKAYVFDVDEYDWERPVVICEQFIPGPEGERASNPYYEECLAKQKIVEEKDKEAGKLSKESARRLSIGIAQVLVAFPLWMFHWRIIERDRKERKRGRASR